MGAKKKGVVMPAKVLPEDEVVAMDTPTLRECIARATKVAMGGTANGAEQAGAFKVVHHLERILEEHIVGGEVVEELRIAGPTRTGV